MEYTFEFFHRPVFITNDTTNEAKHDGANRSSKPAAPRDHLIVNKSYESITSGLAWIVLFHITRDFLSQAIVL